MTILDFSDYINGIDSISIILFCGLMLCFILQGVYYLVYLAKPFRFRKKTDRGEVTFQHEQPSVSIIICAKNESQNLSDFLPSVLEQDYPNYEVIVVNDGSTDESEQLLGYLETKYKHLYRTYIPEQAKNISRKKLAVTIGIKAAKNDVLLFTEANCEPKSDQWIRKMVRHFTSGTDIVIGFSALSKSNGFFSKYSVYDNLFTGLQYLSLALMKRPYMGVGRNLAYRKELFFSHKGFYKHLNLQAGEDDLFINEVATPLNTEVEITPKSIVTSHHNDDQRIWREDKICHATTLRYYKPGPVIFWRFETYSRYGFWGCLIALAVYSFPNLVLLAATLLVFIARMIIQLYVINKSASKLTAEKFYFTLPVFDLIQPIYNLYFYFYRLFRGKKDYTWN